ncbi:hypothetical protein ABDK00_009980 [Niabella insulamsoli]|uniref:hypothetical protein n=1 Tax=Niabella insulamsoli TaxID=3144874 RepID=UPI0031FC4263
MSASAPTANFLKNVLKPCGNIGSSFYALYINGDCAVCIFVAYEFLDLLERENSKGLLIVSSSHFDQLQRNIPEIFEDKRGFCLVLETPDLNVHKYLELNKIVFVKEKGS